MQFLKQFEKELKDETGIGDSSEPPRYWYNSGNYCLNRIVSGSFYKAIPQGRITGLVGPSGTGKSYLTGNIVKMVQQQSDWAFVLDSENALDNDYMGNVGVKVDKDYIYKSVTTIPNAIKAVSTFLKGYRDEYGTDLKAPRVLIALDSLDMLSTESELEHFQKGDMSADQGLRAKQAKMMLRQFVQNIKGLNVSMVITGQVYAATQAQILQGEGVWVVNQAIRYALSQIVLLKKLKLKDENKDVSGIRMIAEGFKTRFTKPYQTVEIEIPYDKGIDPLSGLKDAFISLGVIEKRGSRLALPGSSDTFYERDLPKYVDDLLLKAEALSKKFISVPVDDKEIDPQQNIPGELKGRRADAAEVEVV